MAAGIILAVEIHGGIGALVSAWFLLWHIERIDPRARGAYAFRALLVPGLVMLWPLVLWRMAAEPGPPRGVEAAHRRIWLVLAVLLPLAMIGSLALRQNGPTEAPPVRLAPP
jgi:hypothetical protein